MDLIFLFAEEASVSGDVLLADTIAVALQDARSKEISFLEQQESPEVVTLRSNMQRLRILKERIGVCKQVCLLDYTSFLLLFF